MYSSVGMGMHGSTCNTNDMHQYFEISICILGISMDRPCDRLQSKTKVERWENKVWHGYVSFEKWTTIRESKTEGCDSTKSYERDRKWGCLWAAEIRPWLANPPAQPSPAHPTPRPWYLDILIPWYLDTLIPGYLDTLIPWYPDSLIHWWYDETIMAFLG